MIMNTTNYAHTSGHLLEVKNITKSFGNTVVLNDFSYKFERGVYVLSEPSGAGKTTLLRILCGLEVADSGTVSTSPHAKTVMMFQEDRLLENLSVRANIMLAIQARSQEQKQNARERITEALCAVGLEGTENKTVFELSGGQKRRVALLRTLFADADILLFDEPLKGLDETLKQQVIGFVKPFVESKIVIWVTHTPEEVKLLGSYTALQL
jgi:ABC transporter related